MSGHFYFCPRHPIYHHMFINGTLLMVPLNLLLRESASEDQMCQNTTCQDSPEVYSQCLTGEKIMIILGSFEWFLNQHYSLTVDSVYASP